MCFKKLPIEFDAEGHARLKEGLADPWAVRGEPDPYAELRELAPDAGGLRGQRQRALTHVAGAHAFQSLVVHRRARR
jgi:hydrogenase large subunit